MQTQTLRTQRSVAIVIPAGATTSTRWVQREFIAGAIMSVGFTGALGFEVSPDGATWTPLYDESDTAVVANVTANTARPLPLELIGAPYVRLVIESPAVGDLGFVVGFQS